MYICIYVYNIYKCTYRWCTAWPARLSRASYDRAAELIKSADGNDQILSASARREGGL